MVPCGRIEGLIASNVATNQDVLAMKEKSLPGNAQIVPKLPSGAGGAKNQPK
jgi:hypothetical protein